MSRLGKTIISLVSAGLVAVAGILLYVLWPAITGTINKNKYYTAEDVQTSYDKGFNDGNKSETELTAEITYYKTLVDDYESEVNSLNKEISLLNLQTSQNETTISNLNAIKIQNEKTIEELSLVNSNNELLITELDSMILVLQEQIKDLQNNKEQQSNEIVQKNIQIQNLQNTVSQLQKTNELNVNTISNLNNQISSLNSQITDMTLQIQNNSSSVSSLNAKITELEKSVAYYEEYIANLESGQQVVVTFEFNGSVYNIQVVNKNDIVSVTTPTSTDYVIFNYWTVNGEKIELSSYPITNNVKIIANVTLKYAVNFVVDNNVYNNQVIVKNGFVTLPDNPSKDGYEFDGWTINGVDIINPTDISITEKTTFIAKFTKLHNVTFIYEDQTLNTQIVRNGNKASNVNVSNTEYKMFNGWSLNGAIVNVENQIIIADTTFVASITYLHDVLFVVDDISYNTQKVANGSYVTLPNNPSKTGYSFEGWTINGVDIVNVSNYQILSNMIFIAKFIAADGLFADDGSLIMTWNELLTGDYLTVTDGMLDGSTNAKELVGNLIIPNSVTSLQTYALSDCDSLTSVVVPNSITELPKGCFGLMSSIKNLTIPSTIQVLGESVFSSSLENLYFEGTIEQWINFDFPTITSSAYYTDNFFCQGERITHVDYPTYLTEVKQYSLCGLRDLKTLNLHSGIKAIRTNGIAYCENLEELNIPSSVNLIEKSAFIYNTKIKSVRIPDGLTEISTDMFYQCSSLENIYIPNSVTSIQNEAFMYNAFKTINIPSSVTYIGDKAFSDCPNLETIVLPNTITYIGSHAFEDCPSLKSVTLPAYIDTIYSYTFRNCTSLESIIIPTTVTTIQSYAFTNCAMKSVYIPASVVKFSGSGKTAAFHGNLGIVIYCGVSAKPSSGWGSYWNVVEGTSSSSYVYADVKYGYTYAQYLSETGATA